MQIINPTTFEIQNLKCNDTQSLFHPPSFTFPINIYTSILDKYPILVPSYTLYDISMDIPMYPTVENKFRTDSIRLAAQSRNIRDKSGQCVDPWNRGMNFYQSNYKFNPSIRHEAKVEINSMSIIFIWVIETTVENQPVDLVIWENAKLSYKAKSIQNKFIEKLNPRHIKTDEIYEI